jgi:hypothetical protein
VPEPDPCTAPEMILFDHLVGAGEKCGRYRQTQCLRRLEIDNELKLATLGLGTNQRRQQPRPRPGQLGGPAPLR